MLTPCQRQLASASVTVMSRISELGRRPAVRFARSLLSPRVWLHGLRLAHYWNYSHVAPRKAATIGRDAMISPTADFRNGARLTVGDRVLVNDRATIWAGDGWGRITIGNDVAISPDVFITASNYQTRPGSPMLFQPKDEADVVIGDDVWIGRGAVVLPGVVIGAGSIVAAGAVVTKSLPAGSVAAGVPARVIRQR
jgi:acetyltransferase-like isoleucine patch superfamily enzyme